MAKKRRKSQLSIEQMNAIDLLILGTGDKETAGAVGVHRSTVWEWRTQSPLFIAELNRRRNEVWRRGADKLRALIPKALAVLEEELANPDNKDRGKVALEILRLAGIEEADVRKIGPEDPDAIAYEMLRNGQRPPVSRLAAGREREIEERVRARVLMEAIDKGIGAPEETGAYRKWF
ncbi:MAG: hypothetical protein AB1374_07635 [Bacillota bacterium]